MRRRYVVALALLLFATALVLSAMGWPWWCQAGDLVPWSLDVWSRHNSQHLVDPYTVNHFQHGMLFHGLLWLALRRVVGPVGRAGIGLGIETAWEIVENTGTMIERYRAATISLDYYGDSVVNSLGDVAAFGLGWVAAGAIPVWVSVLVFFTAEGALVFSIRDSLFLNVLMLVHPVAAVKAWQLGG